MKEHLRKAITEFIEGNKPYAIGHPALIQEMLEFGAEVDKVAFGGKALRVYVKCLLSKRNDLAERIKDKYGDLFPRSGDHTLAAGYALLANRKHPKPPST